MNKIAHFLTYHGYLPPDSLNYPPLAYYTMSFFQFLFKPIMPFYGPESAYTWVSTSHVFRYSFLLKSYYLIFDLGVAFLLLRLIKDNGRRLLAFKFWMLNPVVIFTCYIQGQFDILPTFFVVLSLYYVLKNRLTLSLLCLGIGASFKNFPFFFLIPAIILLGKTKIEKFKLFLLGIVPYVVLIAPYIGTRNFETATIAGGESQRIFNLSFALGSFDKVYVFVVGYAVILALAYFYNYAKNSKDIFQILWRINLVICLWFFATVYFHPQWFLWMMPLLTLFIIQSKKLRFIYWIQIVCLFIYTFHFGDQIIVRPFGTILMSPTFYHKLKTPSQIISRFYPPEVFINIFRSILSGILILMIYLVYIGFLRRKEMTN